MTFEINLTTAGVYKYINNILSNHFITFNPDLTLKQAVSKQYVPYDALIVAGGPGHLFVIEINVTQAGEFKYIQNIVTMVELNISPQISLKEIYKHHPEKIPFDVIVVPGGKGVAYIADNDLALKTLKKHLKKNKIVGLIGEAPHLLLVAKLCYGRKITCAKTYIPDMLPHFQFTGESTTVDGNLITSTSPATAMEFALTIVEKLLGGRTADLVAEDLGYKYKSVLRV